ncbi:GntR family transcriptional regulator [Pikeienuella piscinae]|uniref:GntR family transcriptional regulator n=1 Tax=Pikeienuella piscinae TaxID=2748098 RepID=A0A7L5BWD4_9RHOB|nr:GntR family transcriptional regulator [Pikeienuella piscinae]QIE54857.1 GntR family transcriptional regulator [Pikeienuella piscinae]
MDARAADSIADALEQMIVTGEFADGERLSEVALAERFGVSRTPVREAFQRLAASGLIEQLPRRGVFIQQPGPVELLEMFEVMAELESVCGRLAARRIAPARLKELDAANSACRAAMAAEDIDGYYRANEIFHHAIYNESGNGFLAGEAARLHRRLRPYRRMQLYLKGRIAQSMAEHEEIVAALRAADEARAGDALRTHVAVQGEKFHHLAAALKAGVRRGDGAVS